MAYELEKANVEEYYANLLILQYRNKTKARETVKLGADIYLGDGLVFELNDCLNIDIAEGKQLDLIGQILGCNRNIFGFNIDTDYFSFEKTNAFGFSDRTELSQGYWKSYWNSTGSAYSLQDEDYRQLLKFKAVYNLMQGSMYGMDTALYNAFGYDVFLINNKNLTIDYQILKSTTAIQAAKYLGYFKSPIGVGVGFINGGWSPAITISNNYQNKIIYANGLFISVGQGEILTSQDGFTYNKVWEGQTNNYNAQNRWYDIAYGNGLYIAAGGNGLMSSSDTITWNTPIQPSGNVWRSIVYTSAGFVALDENNYVSVSEDGITWSEPEKIVQDVSFTSLNYCNNTIFALSVESNNIYKSTDGINWTATEISQQLDFYYCIIYENSTYFLYGQAATYTSADGSSWTVNQGQYIPNGFTNVKYINGKFYGINDDKYLATSQNGIEWTSAQDLTNPEATIATGNNSIVVLDNTSIILKYIN